MCDDGLRGGEKKDELQVEMLSWDGCRVVDVGVW